VSALFSRFRICEREEKREHGSAKENVREKSESAERDRKKRQFACCMFLLHVPAACPCCFFMLLVYTACQF
jgi:hypothetical protein